MAKSEHYFVGLDLGGTKMLAALLDSKFRVISRSKNATEPHRGKKVFLSSLKECVESARSEAKIPWNRIRAMGVGCPGMIPFPKGVVKLSPNIRFLKNFPLRKILMKMFHVPVLVENDVNAGLYGEWQFGAARGFNHAAGIFLGTGVGGAFIFDGKLYRGAGGAAGEIGHTFLSPPSMMSPDFRATTVEGMLGRLRVAADASYLILKQQAPVLYRTVGLDTKKIKSKALLKSIRGGDQAVRELMLQKSRLLGVLMANVVNLLNPEVIVLGGGLIEAMGDFIIPEARHRMKSHALPVMVKDVKVFPAELGDDAIVKGAAKQAWDWISDKGA